MKFAAVFTCVWMGVHLFLKAGFLLETGFLLSPE